MTDTAPLSFLDSWLRACVFEIARTSDFEPY